MDRAHEQIGEPMTEADLERPPQEDCPCKEGMFPKASRRQFLRGGSLLTAAAASVLLPKRTLAADDDMGSWTVPGQIAKSDYGTRSQFEKVVREATPAGTDALTPLQSLWGIITPSSLHFERHHNGVPTIDPAQHRLIIHGMVDQPMKYSVADLKRFPSVSRTIFIECSGNSGGTSRSATPKTAQAAHGLTSTSEWTGVRVSTLMSEVGVKDGAAWVLAEGADGAMLSRSVPIDKIMDDAFVAFAQNGEAIRPENGYPMRLILPGWEGNINVKWLRRLKIGDKPFMTREETGKYTDLITLTGKARQFTWVMEAKSLITFPSGDMHLPGKGFYEISGIAYSGTGRISKVMVSADGGKSWAQAALQEPVHSKAFTRFRVPWRWDGGPAVLQSQAWDEAGNVQPTRAQLVAGRGETTKVPPVTAFVSQHYNAIVSWSIERGGEVKHVYA